MELEMLRKIVSEVLNVDPREITPETTFADDLGADSLDLLQIVMGMEEAFHVKLEEEELSDSVTVADAVSKIRECINS